MAQEKKYIPELRFPEFQNDGKWNSDTMENIFEIRNGYTPSKSNPEYWEGGTIPWFRMEDIRTNGHVLSDSIQHITPLGVKGSGLFPAYSIIVATTATIGEHALIIVDSLANQRFTFLTKRKSFEDKLDMLYFHYYMFIIDEWCKKNTNAGGLLSVNMDSFKKLTIPYPPSLSEQRKIAECFVSFDKQIDSTKDKLKQLKEHKKGLMQRLFPIMGKTIPELRFPEFQIDGEWNYENGDVLYDSIVNKKHKSDLPILAITQENGAIPRDEINYRVVVEDKSIEGYKVVEIGDFIISLRSFQGGIEYSRYKGLCSPAYIVLRKRHGKICDDFYLHYFKSFQYIQALNRNLEGIRDGKMVSYKQFADIKLPYPCYEEQCKIAKALSSIDDVIQTHIEKISALELHKKGLMQQLFPKL